MLVLQAHEVLFHSRQVGFSAGIFLFQFLEALTVAEQQAPIKLSRKSQQRGAGATRASRVPGQPVIRCYLYSCLGQFFVLQWIIVFDQATSTRRFSCRPLPFIGSDRLPFRERFDLIGIGPIANQNILNGAGAPSRRRWHW